MIWERNKDDCLSRKEKLPSWFPLINLVHCCKPLACQHLMSIKHDIEAQQRISTCVARGCICINFTFSGLVQTNCNHVFSRLPHLRKVTFVHLLQSQTMFAHIAIEIASCLRRSSKSIGHQYVAKLVGSQLVFCVTGGQCRRMCAHVLEEPFVIHKSYFGRFLLLHLITFKHLVCDI